MIHSALYRDAVMLDTALHRHKKLIPLSDFSVAKDMHAVFITATEFPQAALEYPIVFVHVGDHPVTAGPVMSPVLMLGLTEGENLFVDGAAWDARYVPAFIRRYPFLRRELPGKPGERGVMIDLAWRGFSDTDGEPLFDAEGQPAPALTRAVEFLELFESEAERTRLFAQRVVELDLLKEMKADIVLPSGEKTTIDGFFAIDEEKLRALPEAEVVAMHRNGTLMLMYVHVNSLANMKALVQRKDQRERAAQESSPTP